jgi:hypothetical protein
MMKLVQCLRVWQCSKYTSQFQRPCATVGTTSVGSGKSLCLRTRETRGACDVTLYIPLHHAIIYRLELHNDGAMH